MSNETEGPKATREEIDQARYEFSNDDLHIDEGAAVSRSDHLDGVWVAAWVWIHPDNRI